MQNDLTLEKYDRDYYENGVISGKSCYTNYRWMPELTVRMAHKIIQHLNLSEGDKLLDFGCAKGYLVKAFHILDIECYGCDISSYAIKNVDAEVRDYCRLSNERDFIPFDDVFDWIISKDVMEHMTEYDVDIFLDLVRKKTKKMFHVIPLGDQNGHYIIPEYSFDKTHVLAKTREWWERKFREHGWSVESCSYNVSGVKDNWTKKYAEGNVFFVLR